MFTHLHDKVTVLHLLYADIELELGIKLCTNGMDMLGSARVTLGCPCDDQQEGIQTMST